MANWRAGSGIATQDRVISITLLVDSEVVDRKIEIDVVRWNGHW